LPMDLPPDHQPSFEFSSFSGHTRRSFLFSSQLLHDCPGAKSLGTSVKKSFSVFAQSSSPSLQRNSLPLLDLKHFFRNRNVFVPPMTLSLRIRLFLPQPSYNRSQSPPSSFPLFLRSSKSPPFDDLSAVQSPSSLCRRKTTAPSSPSEFF